MNLRELRSLRILAALFCSAGLVAGVEAGSAAWTLLAIAAFSSAVMLQALLSGGAPGLLNVPVPVEATR